MQKLIDPHIHLFDLNEGQYHWLNANNPPFWPDKSLISRSFFSTDLIVPSELCLAGVVHIEAGFNNQHAELELAYLENRALKSVRYLYKSIAYIDLTLDDQDFRLALSSLQNYASLCGIRYILDNDPESFAQHPNVLRNIETLATQNLIFELQCDFSSHALYKLTRLFEKICNATSLFIVINHAGFAPLNIDADSRYNTWLKNMTAFAAIKNVHVKCSGFEMTSRNYTKTNLQDVLKSLLLLFTSHRVMMASNFPLCTFSHSYCDYWALVIESIAHYESDIKDAILFKNARAFYNFET